MDREISPREISRHEESAQKQGVSLRSERGMAFLSFTYFVVLWYLVLSTTMLTRSMAERLASVRSRDQHAAFFLSEAAMDRAMVVLRTGGAYPSCPMVSLLGPFTLATGSYSIDICSPAAQQYRITAHGQATGQSLTEQRDLVAVIREGQYKPFQFVLFGHNSVSVENDSAATTNSYDSSKGAYGGSNIAQKGSIGCNAPPSETWFRGVGYAGTLSVNGDIKSGVAPAPPAVSGSGTLNITGSVGTLSQAENRPSVSVPAGLTCNDLTIGPALGGTPKTVWLPDPTYCVGSNCCFGLLTINHDSKLKASSAVNVYVTRSLYAKNGAVIGGDSTNSPASHTYMKIYKTAGHTVLGNSFGGTTLYGGLYTPYALELRRSTIYGAISCYEAVFNYGGTSALHFNEALRDTSLPSSSSGTPTTLLWQDSD